MLTDFRLSISHVKDYLETTADGEVIRWNVEFQDSRDLEELEEIMVGSVCYIYSSNIKSTVLFSVRIKSLCSRAIRSFRWKLMVLLKNSSRPHLQHSLWSARRVRFQSCRQLQPRWQEPPSQESHPGQVFPAKVPSRRRCRLLGARRLAKVRLAATVPRSDKLKGVLFTFTCNIYFAPFPIYL